MKTSRQFLRTCQLIALAALGGCGAPIDEARPEIPGAAEELVLDDPAAVSGRFRALGRTIRFETVQGGPRPEPYSEDPALTPHEIDARFLDADGRAFAELISGDAFIDPSWAMINSTPLDAVALLDRERDRAAARLLAERLSRVGVVASADGRRTALVALGRALDSPLESAGAAAQPAPSLDGASRSVAQAIVSPTYDHQIEIWSAPIAFTAYLYGRHSGVRIRSTQGIRVFSDTLFGNHGRRPGESGMTMNCSQTFTGRRSATPAARLAMRAELNNHVCSTPYNATSGYLGGRGHNCNDDATVEATMTGLDATNVITSACYDSAMNSYSPACPAPTYLTAR